MRADIVDIFHGDEFDSDRGHGTLAQSVAKVQASGVKGIIHKATQGVRSHDPLYVVRRQAIQAAGLLFGAYDFNTGDPVKQQVDYFFQVAQPDDKMLCALDFEDNKASQMSLDQAGEYLELADAKLGRKFRIYSGNRMKALIVGASAATRAFFAAHGLWGCEYGPEFKMIDVNHKPLPWAKVWLWQFTGDGTGPGPHSVPGIATQGIDISQYNGDPAQLAADWVS